MTDRMVVGADPRDGSEIDDNSDVIKVVIGKTRLPEIEPDPDEFDQAANVFKTMQGLSATVKKRASRMEKMHQGVGGAAGSKKEEEESFSGYDVLGVVRPPYNLDYLAKLYTASPPHFAAVGAKVANIVGLGYDFVESPKTQDKLDSAGTDEKKARLSKNLRGMRQAMFDWVDSCHEEDDFLETLKNVYIDYETTGNGYLEIGRTAGGAVKYIGHIPSITMRVRRDRDGFVQVVGNKSVFFKHFGKDTRNPLGDGRPNEVIHIKKYNPNNSYYGVPDIIAATQAVAGNEFAGRFNLDYFENKAVPRYVIVIKGGTLSNTSQKDIAEFFETSLRGKNHRTLVVPLPADDQDRKTSFEMKPIEAGAQDASFVNYYKINMDAVFMVHRTPSSKTGYAGSGQSLAAARDADKTFKESVCRPEQKILEKKLNRIVKEMTDAFLLKLNELTLTDEDTQSKIDERYLRMKTIVPNEVRIRMGKTGLKGGDEPVEMKPQDAAEQKTQAKQSRTRDSARSAGATDSAGEGRSAKGDGRTTE